jgi:hypothetical protein
MERYKSWMIQALMWMPALYVELGYDRWGMDGVTYTVGRILIMAATSIFVHESLAALSRWIKRRNKHKEPTA